MPPKLESVTINPSEKAKASVIWLHGLGADGHDFANIVPQLRLPEKLAVKFIFPHAPLRPVTLNNGYVMRAWFDLFGLDHHSPVDVAGMAATEQALYQLIAEEIAAGIPANRIVIAGFSQGGAVALFCGLRYPQKLAGILGLSTYMPQAAQIPVQDRAANQHTPIMLVHGTQDNVLPLALGEATRDYLQSLGYPVSWHAYPMAHQVCLEEIRDISAWLNKVLTD